MLMNTPLSVFTDIVGMIDTYIHLTCLSINPNGHTKRNPNIAESICRPFFGMCFPPACILVYVL